MATVTSWKNPLGDLSALAGDTLKTVAPKNSYTNAQYQYDPEALKVEVGKYNVFDGSQMGDLAQYVSPLAKASVNGRYYVRPEDFNTLTSKFDFIDPTQLNADFQNTLKGVTAGRMGNGQVFTNKGAFNTALSNNFDFIDKSQMAPEMWTMVSDGGLKQYKDNLYYTGKNQFGSILQNSLGSLSDQLPAGYSKADAGAGKYNIIGPNGQVVGTGYKSVRDTLVDYAYQNAASRLKYVDKAPVTDMGAETGGVFGGLASLAGKNAAASFTPYWSDGYTSNQYKDRVAAEAGLRNYISTQGIPNYEGNLGDWEALGQVLTGPPSSWNKSSGLGLSGILSNVLGQAGAGTGPLLPAKEKWGGLPANDVAEIIKGANTLYGSTPMFKNGQLVGYRINAAPGETYSYSGGDDKINYSPMGVFKNHDGKSHAWSNNVWRELNDPTGWGKVAMGYGGDNPNVFVPTSKVNDIPGWTNKDSYQRQDKNYTGIPSWVGPLGQVMSFIPGLQPIGMAITAANSLANNNPLGAVMAVVGGSDIGQGLVGKLGSSIGGAMGITDKLITNAIGQGVMTAGGNLLSGAGLKNSLISGALGGLGSYGGGYLADALKGSSPLTQMAARTGLSAGIGGLGSALSGKGFIPGLQSGMVSGLAGSLGSLAGAGLSSMLPKNDFTSSLPGLANGITNAMAREMLKKQLYKR